jgi:hypothetical protein
MLCTTCLGVLEECRNLILVELFWCEIPETTAGKSIFRQGTINTMAPTSTHESTALWENATDYHISIETTPNIWDTSSDEGELVLRDTSDTQPVSATQSERNDNMSDLGRHAIYGHHTALADLKTAARSGCQICWQVWDLLSSERHDIVIGNSEAHEAVESEKTHFCTCIVFNTSSWYIPGRRRYFQVDICYDGTDCAQKVCTFDLLSRTRMCPLPRDCCLC